MHTDIKGTHVMCGFGARVRLKGLPGWTFNYTLGPLYAIFVQGCRKRWLGVLMDVDMDAAHAKGCFVWAGVSVDIAASPSHNLTHE
jgi:hypothetical protein